MKKYNLTDSLKRNIKESLESFKKQFNLDKPTLDDFKRISKIPGANVSLGFDPDDPRVADEEANRQKVNQDFEELRANQDEKDKTMPGRVKKDTEVDMPSAASVEKTMQDLVDDSDLTDPDIQYSTTEFAVDKLADALAVELSKKINAAEPMDQKDLSAAIEAEINNYLKAR